MSQQDDGSGTLDSTCSEIVYEIFYPDSIMSYPSFTVDELMRSWHSLRICSTDIEEICSVTVRFARIMRSCFDNVTVVMV